MQTVKESYSPRQVNKSDQKLMRSVPSGCTQTRAHKGKAGEHPTFKELAFTAICSAQFFSWYVLSFTHSSTKKSVLKQHPATLSDSLEMSGLHVPVVQKTDLRDQKH